MSRSKNSQNSGQRDIFNSSLATLLNSPIRPMPRLLPLPQITPQQVATYGTDRRQFNPTDFVTTPSAVRSGASRIVASRSNINATRFADPKLVGICARREVRKEVLFAKRLTRAGSGSSKRRFNVFSKVSCK